MTGTASRSLKAPLSAGPGMVLGFTLIELLIALSLISIMMVLLYGGLRLGSRTWEGVETTSEQSEGLRLARGFLRRTLLQARSAYWQVDKSSLFLFLGDRQQLEFVTPLSGFVGIGGLYLLRFSQIGQGQRRNLVVQRWLVHRDILNGNGAGVPQWRPLEHSDTLKVPDDAALGLYGTNLLLPNVGQLTFSYFGPLPDGRGTEWQQDWQGRSRLPQLVKISLGKDAGWPDLIVPLAGGGGSTRGGVGP